MIKVPRTTSLGGFTLIELIIVIVLVGILATVVTPIVTNQFQAYTDSSRRATLVQEAQSIMQRLEQDLYNTAPNTTFVDNNDNTIELITLARSNDRNQRPAARYDETDFNSGAGASSLRVFGCITQTDDQRILIGSQDTEDTLDAFRNNSDSGPVTSSTNTIEYDSEEDSGEDLNCESDRPTFQLDLDNEHTFESDSFGYRVYFAQDLVTYRCENGALTRELYDEANPDPPSPQVSADIADCSFTLIAGTTYTPPGLQVDITLNRDGEEVRLIRIFQLQNAS